MDIHLTPANLAFIDELRAHIDELPADATARAHEEMEVDEVDLGEESRAWLRLFGEGGWIGVGWPREYGGQGRSAVEQWLFLEEMAYRKLPTGRLGISSVGPTLMRVGTEAQKRDLIPKLLSMDARIAVGYSEPGAGSDLASLRTSAVRRGDEYVINGQKIYTSSGHYATHIWLAARTGSVDSRHRGITVFILPTDLPGVEIRPIYTQAGGRTNEVFLDDVVIPAENVVGEVDKGWAIIMMALGFERTFPFSEIAHDLEYLIEWLHSDEAPAGILDDSTTMTEVAELAADLQIARLFSMRTAWMVDQDEVPLAESSMSKIWLSEVRQRLANLALDIFGPAGALAARTVGAPVGGRFEQLLRYAPLMKIGGGTNEVQRNIIAQRGLGLPR
jgi:alkylation response protein AidB-like acyl-CoA dehydrogenase